MDLREKKRIITAFGVYCGEYANGMKKELTAEMWDSFGMPENLKSVKQCAYNCYVAVNKLIEEKEKQQFEVADRAKIDQYEKIAREYMGSWFRLLGVRHPRKNNEKNRPLYSVIEKDYALLGEIFSNCKTDNITETSNNMLYCLIEMGGRIVNGEEFSSFTAEEFTDFKTTRKSHKHIRTEERENKSNTSLQIEESIIDHEASDDKILKQERKHLSDTLKFINGIISKAYKKAQYNTGKALSIKSTDHYDNVEKRSFWAKKKSAVEIAEEYEGYVDQPYFGRIDVYEDESKTTKAYYIGDHTILDENYEEVVLAWQSEFGNIFYTNTQKEYKVKNYRYSLELKRRLDVQKSILKGYSDVYNVIDVTLDGDIIDPFLITVLKDKRRQKKLTDIIKTIQANQNDIIRKPLNENFVVQGCAGSGKTMILLHRLSYLVFNNKNLDLSRVKIITPNKLFDEHIDELSKKLELDKIQKMSVEEYYVNLIKQYDSSVKADSKVYSEKALDVDLLEFLYSEDYFDYLEEGYNRYWRSIIESIDTVKLRRLFESSGQQFPKLGKNNLETYDALTAGINRLTIELNKKEKSISDLKNTLETYRTEIPKIQSDIESTKNEILAENAQVVQILGQKIEESAIILAETENYLEEITVDAGRVSDSIFQKKEELNAAEKNLEIILSNRTRYIKFDLFSRTTDDISKYISQNLQEQIVSLSEAKADYEKTPIYNFSKRNRLTRKIAEEEVSFEKEATDVLRRYAEELRDKISFVEKEIEKINNENREALENLTNYKEQVALAQNRDNLLKRCYDIFISSEEPNIQKEFSKEEYKEISEVLPRYTELINIRSRLEEKYRAMVSSAEVVSRQAEKEDSKDIQELKRYLQETNKQVRKLSFNEIYQGFVIGELKEHYKNYDQKFTDHNYRHKLIMKLILCSFYYPSSFVKDNFINIDEAQDLSLIEYRLLKNILGRGAVYNLYGDINQLVYQYKGVNDWLDLSEIIDFKPDKNIYILNENYRNTIEITEFCNKEFGAEILPIGISGEAVTIKDMLSAAQWIMSKKTDNPKSRCAIIYRYGLVGVQNAIKDSLDDTQISWYENTDNKISVLSVESAKGLEFDYVVAVISNMTENEKYIAYTRALDGLCVVRDEFENVIEERGQTNEGKSENSDSLSEVNLSESEDKTELQNTNSSLQNTLSRFEEYCKTPDIDSGKARSYVCAIQYLCDYLQISEIDGNSVSKIKSLEKDICDKDSMLYKELLEFLSLRKQRSYLEKGFIKAALKYFFSFYGRTDEIIEQDEKETVNVVEKPITEEQKLTVVQTAAISQDKPIIPNDESLNLDAFENLFLNMSASYKIFWFKALLNAVKQGKRNPTYNELIDEMVSEAWVYVNKDKLSLGYSDKLEKLVSYVFTNTKLSENAEKEDVLKYMNEAQGIWIYNYKKMIATNVPYRFQAPFLLKFPQSGWSGNSKAVAQKINKYNGLIYYYKTIDDLDSVIEIVDEWYEYLKDNCDILKQWSDYHLKSYLKRRNPDNAKK